MAMLNNMCLASSGELHWQPSLSWRLLVWTYQKNE